MVTSSVVLQAALSLSKDETPPQIGYTTTKKIGRATVRNRTRRRLRAAIRELSSSLLPNTKYVLIGRHNTATIEFSKLLKDLSWGINKINALILNKSPKEEGTKNDKTLSDSSC